MCLCNLVRQTRVGQFEFMTKLFDPTLESIDQVVASVRTERCRYKRRDSNRKIRGQKWTPSSQGLTGRKGIDHVLLAFVLVVGVSTNHIFFVFLATVITSRAGSRYLTCSQGPTCPKGEGCNRWKPWLFQIGRTLSWPTSWLRRWGWRRRRWDKWNTIFGRISMWPAAFPGSLCTRRSGEIDCPV
jgi:hypothetical protein